jgi:hypothetical protein
MATRQELNKKISLLLQESDSYSLPEWQQGFRDVIFGFGMLILETHPEGLTGEGAGPAPATGGLGGTIIEFANSHSGGNSGPGPSYWNKLIVDFAAIVLAMQEPKRKKRRK